MLLAVALLYGVYLGVLTGIIPALVCWALTFSVRYLTGIPLPISGVVGLGVLLAGLNGILLAFADPSVLPTVNPVMVGMTLFIVVVMVLYAQTRGDRFGVKMARQHAMDEREGERLPADHVTVAGDHEVTIEVAGDVGTIEGYPSLPEDLRATIRDSEWRFPADLPIEDIEIRLAQRLRNAYDLGDVAVSIDEEGQARVASAPPFSSLSKRIEEGFRAVSVNGLVPTGLAVGDVVTISTADTQVRGTIVSAGSSNMEFREGSIDSGKDISRDFEIDNSAGQVPTTTGGEGQVTVSVRRTDAEALLRSDQAKIIVESRGSQREYTLLSVLRRAGKRLERMRVRPDSQGEGQTLGTATRETEGVVILAARDERGWEFDPSGSRRLNSEMELYAAGSRDSLETLQEVMS